MGSPVAEHRAASEAPYQCGSSGSGVSYVSAEVCAIEVKLGRAAMAVFQLAMQRLIGEVVVVAVRRLVDAPGLSVAAEVVVCCVMV